MMAGLGDYPVGAVLRAEDLARATKFYTEVLGLKPNAAGGPSGEGMFSAGDGTGVMIYERPGMPAPQNTTLGFGVPRERFDKVVAELRAKGVTFEEYHLPEIGLKTVDGSAEIEGVRLAWFKDSEGSIVNISAM